ncbi:hypothetical protein [uncultured Sphingomonas sp.]|uniref:hypothetical protein n=1 Tax=uncultured Sphingomonas sp. TaxID=158754 RepID=UPI0025ECF10F|nr:hypothetical protein [uncultured Sphingomonas sp.]
MALQPGTQPVKGAQLFVSVAVPATFDKTGYEALTWTKVGRVQEIGTIGASTEVVSFTDLDGNTEKHQGATNNGALTPTLGVDETDAGQALLYTSSKSGVELSTKVLLKSGAARYNGGRAFGMPETIGQVNSIVTAAPRIELNRETVRVAAT